MGVRDWFEEPYTDLDAQAGHAVVPAGQAVLVDVREPIEWQTGRAPKARHLPLSQLADRPKELPAHRQLIFACRSARGAAWLAKQRGEAGNVANLKSGVAASSRSGLPVVAKGGRAGRVA